MRCYQNNAKSDLYHTCYIYTDIVQNQLLGDVKAPLLRLVPVKEGKLTYVHYDRPHFLSIKSKQHFCRRGQYKR